MSSGKCSKLANFEANYRFAKESRGGGTLVLFMVRGRAIFRGTFFKPLRNYGYHFHNYLTFHGIMGVLFRGFFIIYGIMAQIFIQFVESWR